uniref:Uncharacterized protein n=1 Tax=Anopheles merus TaxID=30066 RepID=A0A182UYJ6_ANOME
MPFGRKSPLEALAMPGAIIAYKYSQFRQRRREAANRRVTERELSALHTKILLVSRVERLAAPEAGASVGSHRSQRKPCGRVSDSAKYCQARAWLQPINTPSQRFLASSCWAQPGCSGTPPFG